MRQIRGDCNMADFEKRENRKIFELHNNITSRRLRRRVGDVEGEKWFLKTIFLPQTPYGDIMKPPNLSHTQFI